jgi:hypothetical protein
MPIIISLIASFIKTECMYFFSLLRLGHKKRRSYGTGAVTQ